MLNHRQMHVRVWHQLLHSYFVNLRHKTMIARQYCIWYDLLNYLVNVEDMKMMCLDHHGRYLNQLLQKSMDLVFFCFSFVSIDDYLQHYT